MAHAELGRLKLVATHPDAHGGLGFLGLSTTGFTPIAFALSAAIGGDWRNRILNYGATLSSFRLPASILFVLMFIFAIAPLSFFVIKLTVLRKRSSLGLDWNLRRRGSVLRAIRLAGLSDRRKSRGKL